MILPGFPNPLSKTETQQVLLPASPSMASPGGAPQSRLSHGAYVLPGAAQATAGGAGVPLKLEEVNEVLRRHRREAATRVSGRARVA